MDKNLALEFVRATEDAAIASAKWMGKGDKHAADKAATDKMRSRFNKIDFDGRIVIGEGERDEAPMLYIGEKVGCGTSPKTDIAVDPLECTNSVAYGRPNSMSVLAAAPRGSLLHAPDTYMDKICVNSECAGKVDLDWSVERNIRAVAKALGKDVTDVSVVVLDRDRHEKLIADIRKCDARIFLITDGDIMGAIAPSIPESGIDILLGIGAAPEGVISAAAINCIGGDFQGRLSFRNNHERDRAKKMGIKNLNKKFEGHELASSGKTMFAATGVSDSPILRGVNFRKRAIITHSLVMRETSKTFRFIETHHKYEKREEED